MKHPEAVAILQSIIETLDELEDTPCLSSTNCISKLLLIDEKLSKLIRYAVNRATDERDCLQIEF